MSEKDERQVLIEKIRNSVDRILGNTHMSEEEKARVFQEALQLRARGTFLIFPLDTKLKTI